MKDDQQFDLKDFILSTIRVYVNYIGTEKDTAESYFSIFKSIQDYKVKILKQDLRNFLSEIQNVLQLENDNVYRKNAGEFLLAIIKLRSTTEFIVRRWNDYYLEIINNKENPFENNETENLKNSFMFYLYFDKSNDEFADVQPLVCGRELLVGDILNFSDSEILENLEFTYKTHLFKIVKREYSVEFREMGLHLVPYSE